jgi:hypothetical protein
MGSVGSCGLLWRFKRVHLSAGDGTFSVFRSVWRACRLWVCQSRQLRQILVVSISYRESDLRVCLDRMLSSRNSAGMGGRSTFVLVACPSVDSSLHLFWIRSSYCRPHRRQAERGRFRSTGQGTLNLQDSLESTKRQGVRDPLTLPFVQKSRFVALRNLGRQFGAIETSPLRLSPSTRTDTPHGRRNQAPTQLAAYFRR